MAAGREGTGGGRPSGLVDADVAQAALAERFGNALLFRPDDVDDLARVLRRFLDEPPLWGQLAPKRKVRSVADDVDAQLARYARLSKRATR